ncbi:MAG: hypothetical protein FJ363_03440 [Gemmatimonadetes bacterium]|nr:hypothetical protein [Gemmatimonadota bacterium]
MSIRSVFLLAAALVATPAALRAQAEEIDFTRARKEFVAGQPRNAANSVLMASLGVRTQVGRCRDETVGTNLLNAESNLEKLAAALRAGTVKDVKSLDSEFQKIDLALAHHHLLLVKAVLQRPRPDNIPTAANDLDRLAFHYERALMYGGAKPSTEQAAAIAEARKLGTEIEKSAAIPGTAGAVVASLEKLVVVATPAP